MQSVLLEDRNRQYNEDQEIRREKKKNVNETVMFENKAKYNKNRDHALTYVL